jgi:hypothetical protein
MHVDRKGNSNVLEVRENGYYRGKWYDQAMKLSAQWQVGITFPRCPCRDKTAFVEIIISSA